MGAQFETVALSEVGKIVTGKTPPTKQQEYYGNETPFLTPSDDMNQKYVPQTSRCLSALGVELVRNCYLPAGSICVSCIGSDLGKVAISREPIVTNQQINSVIPKTDRVDTDYLYYALCILGKKMNYLGKTSTAVPIVNKSTFSRSALALPSLNVQRKIGAVLSAIDDAIRLNNRINDYLAA